MRTVIPDTNVDSSCLGFGTASLHHLFSTSSRQRLLSVAHEEGIRHFDCARLYGHGLAERELGTFAKSRRQDLVICTKVGLLADPLLEKFALLMYAAKALRKARLGKRNPYVWPKYLPLSGPDIAATAEANLTRSLAALNSDYVDILFLHEPPPEMIAVPDALAEWFAGVKKRGLARHVGIAGSAQVVAKLALTCPTLAEVLQVSDSIQSRNADYVTAIGRNLQITYGYFRRAAGRSPQTNASADLSLKTLAKLARLRNPRGVILFSSKEADHIREMCKAFQSDSTVFP